MTEPLLNVSDLSIEFASKQGLLRVVDHVSFTVEAGGAVGIVGESGSGKSVTALSLLRLIPETRGRIASGRIVFDGLNLLDLPPQRMPDIRGSRIAIIFQEPMSSLNPVMTIGAQIEEAIRLHKRLTSEERRFEALEMLRLVGIPDPASRFDAYPHQCSGGMRQRVMIAMAIACDPKLLIADEPTTAIDVTIQAQILELIKSIRRTRNTAVLMISHDLAVIADICEHVIVMYAGRVVEQGELRAVFKRPYHPYTQGLLQSIPRLTDDRRRLFQIGGSVPVAGTTRKGCPFEPRCTARIARCAETMPPMVRFGERHQAACWVAAEQAV